MQPEVAENTLALSESAVLRDMQHLALTRRSFGLLLQHTVVLIICLSGFALGGMPVETSCLIPDSAFSSQYVPFDTTL
jgi:hypothetical protein